jgi:competence protein ComEA
MSMFRRLFLSALLAFAVPAAAFAQVDINNADAKTLAESLDGVGLVKAEAIVAYREAHGPFRHAEDLKRVKGIGAKTIDANRDAIVIVGGGPGSVGGPRSRPAAAR